MSDKKNPALVFGNVAQCRENGEIILPHLIEAAIHSMLLPESSFTLKQFLVKRVFSNGGPITNREICDVAKELFGANGQAYFALLESNGGNTRLGYSAEEIAIIIEAIRGLDHAHAVLIGEMPEKLHPFEDALCDALGFRFSKHNRH